MEMVQPGNKTFCTASCGRGQCQAVVWRTEVSGGGVDILVEDRSMGLILIGDLYGSAESRHQ